MCSQGRTTLLLLLATAAAMAGATKVEYSVECSSEAMVVRVPSEGVLGVELDKWGQLPGCQARQGDTHWTLTLPLDERLACGTTRVKNKLTGETVFYHRVSVATSEKEHLVLVKCRIGPDNESLDNIVKRDVLPQGFVEPDYIEITSEISGTAPVPILSVGVRQNGELVGGQINVRPGTPLEMEVYLDNTSAGTYGILMSFMEVTDNADKREIIIFNGCSVDPVLFDNFITETGDSVSAKFRAFKFPETNFVLFRGTVDVCLDKCQGIACSNGQLGYGRRRRDIDSRPNDPNKIFEVTMMTFLKVDENLNQTTFEETFEEETLTSKAFKDAGDEALALERDVAWTKPAEEPLIRSSGDEPSFIFFNGASELVPSGLFFVLAAALLLFFQH